MRSLRNKFILPFLLLNGMAQAQSVLTLEKAVESALYANYGLLISRQDAEMAENNSTRANAGMMPKLDLNGGTQISSIDLNQKFNNGTEINKSGVISKSFNGQLLVSWTLFDGTRMFATRDKLNVLEKMGSLQVQMVSEELVKNVVISYAEIIRQKYLIRQIESTIRLDEERLKLAETRLLIGKGNRSEVLQATIDLNMQKSNLLRQSGLLNSAKINLNLLMARSGDAPLDVVDSLPGNKQLILEDILASVNLSNKELMSLRLTIDQRSTEIREQKSSYYPRVNLNTGYNFSSNSSSQGLFLMNQNRGPVAGLTFNWTLYNGTQQQQVTNSVLNREKTKLQLEDALQKIRGQVLTEWQFYQNALLQAEMEGKNRGLAEENLSIVMTRFRLGEATVLELKDAQLSAENAATRYANAMYEVRAAETRLLFLAGKILQP